MGYIDMKLTDKLEGNLLSIRTEKCCSKINGMLRKKFRGRLFTQCLIQTMVLCKQWKAGVLYKRVDKTE